MQQKTHYVSTDGSAGKAIPNDKESQRTGEDRLPTLQGNNGNHSNENTKAPKAEALPFITREGGFVM